MEQIGEKRLFYVIPLTVVLIIGSCSQQIDTAKPHTCVFIEHIGDSDKPILPIVISNHKVSIELIATVLDKLEAHEAYKLQIHSDPLQKITKLIHKTDTDAAGHILQITILNFDQEPRQHRTSFTYNNDQAVTILTGIEQIAVSANENKLVNAIGSMEGRLPQKRRLEDEKN